ncbi:ISL3 family transposase [Exiguobacterium sp. SH0S7]|uniref:ISL3 family transposase n=1 Tax=Exiguobacterium sp. SH0S7 TaxID=2510951 RepID=UPI00103EC606|nr:ISL3 family transposase [Exiguobacterium sp. SH0S7]TCI72202.1 ISL3 family transposase [Exiguobacterium sp. SH0S7]
MLDEFLPELEVVDANHFEETYQIICHGKKSCAPCPHCNTVSHRIHSRYIRTLKDERVFGMDVQLRIQARRFFCDDPACLTSIFTERFPSLCRPHSRRTIRLDRSLLRLLSGMSAIGLERILNNISDSTLLRMLKQSEHHVKKPAPRVIGIDDWAWRKRKKYGTIICDLETRRPIALLPSRDVNTVSAWIRSHPTIQVVARDGSVEFREAIRLADETIQQVSDRWHLFHNLGKKIEEILKRRLPSSEKILFEPDGLSVERELTNAERRKWTLILAVQQDAKQGVPISELVRRHQIDPKTCRRYLKLTEPPRISRSYRRHSADVHKQDIVRWIRQGRTTEWMYRALKRKGYVRGISTFRPYVAKLKKAVPHEIIINRRIIQKVLWEDEPSNKPLLLKILGIYPFLKQLNKLVRSFKELFGETTSEQDILNWCEQAERMNETPLSSFATYIRCDVDAIRLGMTLPWSNGMVEGQVNRLKTIKRQMYGRAGLELLRIKILSVT